MLGWLEDKYHYAIFHIVFFLEGAKIEDRSTKAMYNV
jgi:hypothetical protein